MSSACFSVVKMRKPGKSRESNAYFYPDHKDEKDKYFFKVLVGDFRERLVSLLVNFVLVLGRCSLLIFAVSTNSAFSEVEVFC